MSGQKPSFEEVIDIRVNAPPQTVEAVLKQVADQISTDDGGRFKFDNVKHTYGPALDLRAEVPQGSGPIGILLCLPLLDDRTLLQVPKGRGSRNQHATYERDPEGHLFWAYLQAAENELQRLELITARSRFNSVKVLDTAVRQLAPAEDSHSYAAVANVCRAAMIALANEVYKPYMLPSGKDEPKGDEADTKLTYTAHHYAAGCSKRQKEGLDKVINGAWDFAQALTHRKNATREDAEVCVVLTTTVFDSFALLVPNAT